MRKKIIATLGPSSINENTVKRMDLFGVDIFRINLSHIPITEFEKIVRKVKQWTNKPVSPDTEGAQLRTGNIDNNEIQLNTGKIINFSESLLNVNDGLKNIPLNIKNPGKYLSEGDLLRIDFNSVIVQLIKIDNGIAFGRVIKGGKVGRNKGIAVDRPVYLPRFTEKDLKAFSISKKLELKTFFLSFCANGDDVCALRELFDYQINVISKIESNKALNNLSSICKESDAILIDRGDLSRDVSLTKIAFAQSYILDTSKSLNVPAYVATNLVESMVEKPEPTRAEINDMVHALKNGADGLVLAAESAIGAYPTECVRVVSNVIKEVENLPDKICFNYLVEPSIDNIILPHGGHLIQQLISYEKEFFIHDLPVISVNQRIESDIIQISNGTYSPLGRFMDQEEFDLVLEKNELLDGTVWSMPILFQINKEQMKATINDGQLALKSEQTGKVFAVIEVEKIEELKFINKIAKNWFGTDDSKHPGVAQFLKGGSFILSGKPFLIESQKPVTSLYYELTPTQSRKLFNLCGWSNIIGYHTRNVPHRGHEYIQRKALEETHADGIFISPVTGIKKKNDFTGAAIIRCFEKLIEEEFYNPYGAVIGSFNTYSRYSGPKEAVFTAICRKNYGCNYFIVGRDHTGVGEYYSNDESQKIFDHLDIGIKILRFDEVGYCEKRKIVTVNDSNNDSMIDISGSKIRSMINNNQEIPDYILRSSLLNELRSFQRKSRKDNLMID